MDDKIQGVIAHLIIDGQLRITVTDFDGSEAGGFSKLKRQQSRVKAKMGREFVERYGGPVMVRAVSPDDSLEIIYKVFTGGIAGFEYVETLVGYDEEDVQR